MFEGEKNQKPNSRGGAGTKWRGCLKIEFDDLHASCPGRGAALLQRCTAEPGPRLQLKKAGPRPCSAPLRKSYALRCVRGTREKLRCVRGTAVIIDIVMAGLDPAIHPLHKTLRSRWTSGEDKALRT
jgi:hypothetical protein